MSSYLRHCFFFFCLFLALKATSCIPILPIPLRPICPKCFSLQFLPWRLPFAFCFVTLVRPHQFVVAQPLAGTPFVDMGPYGHILVAMRSAFNTVTSRTSRRGDCVCGDVLYRPYLKRWWPHWDFLSVAEVTSLIPVTAFALKETPSFMQSCVQCMVFWWSSSYLWALPLVIGFLVIGCKLGRTLGIPMRYWWWSSELLDDTSERHRYHFHIVPNSTGNVFCSD